MPQNFAKFDVADGLGKGECSLGRLPCGLELPDLRVSVGQRQCDR